MNAARRRFIQRSLGVAGYVLIAAAIVPVVAVTSEYAYRTIAARDAAAARDVTSAALAAAARDKADAAAAADAALAAAGRADNVAAAVRDATRDKAKADAAYKATFDAIIDAGVPAYLARDEADAAHEAAFTADDHALGVLYAAERAQVDSLSRILSVSILSLSSLVIAGLLFWARRFLALGDEEGSA